LRNTSAIRRVDDLGRVVIPKEIRENLRLVTGAVVQVSCDEKKHIIITTYSKVKNILDFAQMCLNSFADFKELSIYICDIDKIIAMNREGERRLMDTPISNELYTCLQGREIQIRQNEKVIDIHEIQKGCEIDCSQAIFPILCNGDVCGGLIFMSKNFIQNFDFAKPIHKFLCDYLSE